MKAGLARAKITPPVGTTMMGFGGRDMAHGCDAIHDDIYTRALYLEHGGEKALIVGFDLCFLGRAEVDRFRAALGRKLGLAPRQILLNTSHSHVGPSVGTWYSAGYGPPNESYLKLLEQATLNAGSQARDAAREATMWAGVGRSALPLSRRWIDEEGSCHWRPNPDGPVYTRLPVCLFKDRGGKPVCLLFSVSTHPSMMGGYAISAEYPGVAIRRLDEHLGVVASLFLQGVAGDSKPSVVGKGSDKWRSGTWEELEQAGGMVAREAMQAIEKGLAEVEPDLRSAMVETRWPLQAPPPRSEFEAVIAKTKPEDRKGSVRCMWAKKWLAVLDRGGKLPTTAPVNAHGIQLGKGLRLFGLEGEAVAEWGDLIEKFYGGGITFPLGYTDGQGLYLPVSRMLPEGGYEVTSAWEYGFPCNLAKGMEEVVLKALAHLRDQGVR